jgi:hypothetical protein
LAQAIDRVACTIEDSRAAKLFLGDGRWRGAAGSGQGGGARLQTFTPRPEAEAVSISVLLLGVVWASALYGVVFFSVLQLVRAAYTGCSLHELLP